MTRARRWLDEHPIFARAYVPVVVTLTFAVEVLDHLR